ncbi:hypothetical protein ACFRFH_11950 [Leifsonia sp. NPDC056824]|uniref:hypothetical protein n=1 Tax=Leifsonia sp. NPDC056824 TaxID=3345953 RepID=UPI0036C574B6
MTVNISGQLPAEAQNGMVAIEEDWLGDRTPDPIVAVVIIERAGFKFDDAKQERRATMKFTHIEPMDGEAAGDARVLLENACSARGGEPYRRPEPDAELDIPEDETPEDLTPALGSPFDSGDAA